MAGFLIPFVVGALGNLAQRKEDAKAIAAASAKSEQETGLAALSLLGQQKLAANKEKFELEKLNRANWHAEKMEFIKTGENSMFPMFGLDLTQSLFGETYGSAEVKPEHAPVLDMMHKVYSWKNAHEGSSVIAKANKSIGQFATVNDEDYAQLLQLDKLYGGTLLPQINSHIVSSVAAIHKEVKDNKDAYISGPLNWNAFGWGNLPQWIQTIIGTAARNQNIPNLAIKSDGSMNIADMEVNVNDKKLYEYTYPNIMGQDKKVYNDTKKMSAFKWGVYHADLKTLSQNGPNIVQASEGVEAFNSSDALHAGWNAYSEIFTRLDPATNAIVPIVNFSPFSNDNLKEKSLFIFARSLRQTENRLGESRSALYNDGVYFPWQASATYRINALASVATNQGHLPGISKASAVSDYFQTLYPTAAGVLKEKLGVTETTTKEYRNIADIGTVALGTSLETQLILKDAKIGGTAFFTLAKAKEQVIGFLPQLFRAFGVNSASAYEGQTLVDGGFDTIKGKIDGELQDVSTKLATLTNMDAGERTDDQQQTIENLLSAQTFLRQQQEILNNNGYTTTIGGKEVTVNFNNAFKQLGSNKSVNQDILAARLGLLRTSLVFYAAAIFQGEGGKAISDGDRKAVERALAISNWATVDQARASLIQFDKSMGTIVARARAVSSGQPSVVWAGLNYYNVYDNESEMMDRLPDSQQWQLFKPQPVSRVPYNQNQEQVSTEVRDVTNNIITIDGQEYNLDDFVGKAKPTSSLLTTYNSLRESNISIEHAMLLENWLVTNGQLAEENRRVGNNLYKTEGN